MTHWAKVRYTDSKGRSHYVTVESDLADRTFIEELVRSPNILLRKYIFKAFITMIQDETNSQRIP